MPWSIYTYIYKTLGRTHVEAADDPLKLCLQAKLLGDRCSRSVVRSRQSGFGISASTSEPDVIVTIETNPVAGVAVA